MKNCNNCLHFSNTSGCNENIWIGIVYVNDTSKLTCSEHKYKDEKKRVLDELLDKYIPLLTTTESKVLIFLTENNRVATFDEIKNAVWGDKPMSRFTLRNKINSIRKKTYDDLILNRSGIGYEFNRGDS